MRIYLAEDPNVNEQFSGMVVIANDDPFPGGRHGRAACPVLREILSSRCGSAVPVDALGKGSVS